MMLLPFLISLLLSPLHGSSLNEFDTYSPECPRVRRAWSALSASDKSFYIRGLMALRAEGQQSMDLDEFIAVASVHEDQQGEIEHYASSYLFWHGYPLWEVESRVRNLGGEFSCFAVPYWDFTTEAERQGMAPGVFDEFLGGNGNPEDYFTVNHYSWEYATSRWWVPAHCDAEGDEYPLCSLKRYGKAGGTSAAQLGKVIRDNANFAEFSAGYSAYINIPKIILTDVDYLNEPVVTSYDPIWYLFHSMVSYHQALWTVCHGYDQIAPEDLDEHEEAYSAYCAPGTTCGKMALDDAMVYGGLLPDKEWAFIHQQDLTVRKSYHFPRWNILYDLGEGQGFFSKSGSREWCQGKLNSDWFVLHDDDKIADEEVDGDVDGEVEGLDRVIKLDWVEASYHGMALAAMLLIAVVAVVLLAVCKCQNGKGDDEMHGKKSVYGSECYGAI